MRGQLLANPRGTTRWATVRGPGWLLVICASRVRVYMVCVAYAATLPGLEREWRLVSLGIAGAGAVASVAALHATPEVAILRGHPIERRRSLAVSVR